MGIDYVFIGEVVSGKLEFIGNLFKAEMEKAHVKYYRADSGKMVTLVYAYPKENSSGMYHYRYDSVHDICLHSFIHEH